MSRYFQTSKNFQEIYVEKLKLTSYWLESRWPHLDSNHNVKIMIYNHLLLTMIHVFIFLKLEGHKSSYVNINLLLCEIARTIGCHCTYCVEILTKYTQMYLHTRGCRKATTFSSRPQLYMYEDY